LIGQRDNESQTFTLIDQVFCRLEFQEKPTSQGEEDENFSDDECHEVIVEEEF
jgi:hypothetical protein